MAADAITTGTRVIHRRYSWLVGIVTEAGPNMSRVQWNHHPTGHIAQEMTRELRATPAQPIPERTITVLDDALNGRR